MYIIDLSITPPSCLPENLNTSNLVDITRIGDSWRRYIDVSTGKTHDGEEYAERLQQMMTPNSELNGAKRPN